MPPARNDSLTLLFASSFEGDLQPGEEPEAMPYNPENNLLPPKDFDGLLLSP